MRQREWVSERGVVWATGGGPEWVEIITKESNKNSYLFRDFAKLLWWWWLKFIYSSIPLHASHVVAVAVAVPRRLRSYFGMKQ